MKFNCLPALGGLLGLAAALPSAEQASFYHWKAPQPGDGKPTYLSTRGCGNNNKANLFLYT